MSVNLIGLLWFIAGFAIASIISMLRRKKTDEPKCDERTKKISGVVFRYSWLATFIVIAVLFWIATFAPEKLSVHQVLAIIISMMLVVPYLLLQYFGRKGE